MKVNDYSLIGMFRLSSFKDRVRIVLPRLVLVVALLLSFCKNILDQRNVVFEFSLIKTNWIYLVALALYVQVTLGAAIMLRVISLFDPCSLYQLGFRGDIYLPCSVNCSCRAFELFIPETAPAYKTRQDIYYHNITSTIFGTQLARKR